MRSSGQTDGHPVPCSREPRYAYEWGFSQTVIQSILTSLHVTHIDIQIEWIGLSNIISTVVLVWIFSNFIPLSKNTNYSALPFESSSLILNLD